LTSPFHQQFYLYLLDLVTKGDMGTSYTTAQPVARDLLQRFPATLELVLYGMGLAVALAIPLGILSALHKDSPIDHAGRVIAVVGVSVPVFWLGLVFLYVFFLKLQWAPPPVGRLPPTMSPPPHVTGLYTLDAVLAGQQDLFKAALAALVLPAISLAVTAMAPLARMTRSAMVEALESEYVRAALALGLPRRVIIWDYAFRNAVIPILTIFAGVFGYALGGVVLVEFVFSWPGLGLYTLNAILSSDFPARSCKDFDTVLPVKPPPEGTGPRSIP
jgi:peptide/nickel transport system permease protein